MIYKFEVRFKTNKNYVYQNVTNIEVLLIDKNIRKNMEEDTLFNKINIHCVSLCLTMHFKCLVLLHK